MYSYKSINIPIDLGKNELTPECAYFLGAILSADESFVYEGKRLWLAPVRHNYGLNIQREINEHMSLLSQIIGRANGKILDRDQMKAHQWFHSSTVSRAFTTKQGFAALFESDENTSIDQFINDVQTAIEQSPREVKQAFVVGAFDGRCALDINRQTNKVRYLALDCANINVANYLTALLDEFGIEYNYNTSRDRIEGGLPRREQLRIPGHNLLVFIDKIGMVSPLKFAQIKSLLAPTLYVHNNNRVLWGLKTISSIPQPEAPFALIAQDAEDIEHMMDNYMLDRVLKSSYEGNPNFQYAGVPKEKSQLVASKNGKTYRRDRSVAINALVLANYKCEIDEKHPTFIRRNSSLPYSEPHHLVPLAYYEMFDVSLDVEENIVSLCSTCHNHLHYGRDIVPLLTKLYEERKEHLKLVGIIISFDDLLKMYNAR